MLVISYANRELAHRCTKLDVAQEWLGPTDAQALIEMIADAEALANAKALIDFYRAKVVGKKSISIAFSPKKTALLEATGPRIRRVNGEPVWEQVRRLMLVEVTEH